MLTAESNLYFYSTFERQHNHTHTHSLTCAQTHTLTLRANRTRPIYIDVLCTNESSEKLHVVTVITISHNGQEFYVVVFFCSFSSFVVYDAYFCWLVLWLGNDNAGTSIATQNQHMPCIFTTFSFDFYRVKLRIWDLDDYSRVECCSIMKYAASTRNIHFQLCNVQFTIPKKSGKCFEDSGTKCRCAIVWS